MAILSTNDLRTRIQTLVGENTDDDTLDFLQDFDDTITDLESKGATDYQELYKAEVQKNKDLDASEKRTKTGELMLNAKLKRKDAVQIRLKYFAIYAHSATKTEDC